MRSLERNKITIYYALYGVKTPVLDELGNDTGQTSLGYGNPLKFKIRVSPSKGEAEEKAFGKFDNYDRGMYTADKTFPIDNFSRLWIDTLPIIKDDLSTETPYDYDVTKVAKDINEWQFAIKKRVS